MAEAGKLYVVATPIGNLADLSLRAREVLGSVDVVASEDTRVTGRLLERCGISARQTSYREQNEARLAPRLVERMLDGESVALVSDAGTPCISDPGYRLVRAAAEAGIEVVAVPGPSAVTALLSVSGLPTDRYVFEGFLPTAKAPRRRAIESLGVAGATVVLYESPRRVVGLLEDLATLLGDPPVAVGRELTKRFEEVLRGRASEIAERLKTAGARGEFVLAVSPPRATGELGGAELEAAVEELFAEGLSTKDVASQLKPRGASRREVYDIARRLKG